MRRQSELPGKLQPQQKLSPGSPTPSVADPSTNNAAKPCADNEADNTAVVRGQRVEGTTKGGRSRVVSIDRETVSIPREHRRQAEERQAASTAWTDNDGLVFTTKWGEPLYPDTVTALVSKLITAHNKSVAPGLALPHARLHDLRHLHATTLLLAGVPVHVVAARLGHVDPAVTLRVYSHVLREHAFGVGDVFARAVKASVSKSASKPGQTD